MATLQYLKDQGHEMYIATNKRLFPTKRILEIKGINELFSGIMANEMQTGITPTKRQMIAELKKSGGFEEGFMVGDSVSDIMAGNAEKLVTIAVTYGYEHAGLLAAQNPNYTIDNFGELKTIIVP